MYPSSATCRTQEAYHLDRAAQATLENVRVIAATAAIAWGGEAASAERREARQERVRLVADQDAARKQAADDEFARLASENPDRGRESL